jgi:hypothetical protein
MRSYASGWCHKEVQQRRRREKSEETGMLVYVCQTKNNDVPCGFLPSHLVYENNLVINSSFIVLSR